MKKYMITSNYSCSDQIKNTLPDFVLYRDKQNKDYATDAESFVKICREYKDLKYFLHADVDLAYKLKADGVHLTSSQFDQIIYAKSKNLEVIISTHSFDEVIKAQELGADAVTYSPIFYTPNKGEPKGVDDLKRLVDSVDINVFALGGITGENEIKQIENSKAYGFASIRYFC